MVFPERCLSCFEPVEGVGKLCGACFREAEFLTGLRCDSCGAGLPGEGGAVLCDECIMYPMPWARGRAAFRYDGTARKIVLSLKHADRLDAVGPLAAWMTQSGADILEKADLLVPVPVHWTRLVKRRYNQSVELARGISRKTGIPVKPRLLIRTRATGSQDGLTRVERFANTATAFRLNSAQAKEIKEKRIVLVDDVMTSGATLAACSDVLLRNGATEVNVLVLARVATHS